MRHPIPAGTRVEIELVALPPEQRAAGLPADTAAQPYRCWVKGFLLTPAAPGDPVEIETLAGRRVGGRLLSPDSGYTHSFGTPHPAMLAVGSALRRRLAEGQEAR